MERRGRPTDDTDRTMTGPRRGVISGLLLAGLAAVAWVGLRGGPPVAPDTMFRGDAAHTGVYAGSAPSAYGGLLWRAQTDGPVRSTPAVVGGRLFVGSGDAHVYAFDARTGERLWRFRAATSVTGSPALSGELVYVTDHSSTLYALDAGSGERRWAVETGETVPFPWGYESGDIYASSPVIADGTVFFGAGDGHVYAVDASSGNVRWRAATDGRVRSTPAVADGRVYAGGADGVVYAFGRDDGRLLWRHETEGSTLESAEFGYDRRTVQSSPAVADGRVFVGARDGFLYALDAETGERLWRFDHEISWVNSSPAVAEGLVIAGSSDAQFVHAVDAESGEERWRVDSAGIVWTSPMVVDGRVILAEGFGRVRVLELESGEPVWSAWTGGRLFGSPVIAGGTIYVGSMDGGVYALRADAERTLARAVFWDSAHAPAAWYVDNEELRDFLANREYTVLDAGELREFMRTRIEDRRPSVVVFAVDHAPSGSIEGLGESTFRRYLDAGGSVVWPGLAPLLWRGDPRTGESGGIQAIDRQRPAELLEVDFDAANFDPLGAIAAPAGRNLGLPRTWLTAWTVDVGPGMEVFALDELGRAASWRRSYGGPPGTGFTRLWGGARPAFDPAVAMAAAEIRPVE